MKRTTMISAALAASVLGGVGVAAVASNDDAPATSAAPTTSAAPLAARPSAEAASRSVERAEIAEMRKRITYHEVTIDFRGDKTKKVSVVHGSTVKDAIEKAGLKLNGADDLSLKPSAVITSDKRIKVTNRYLTTWTDKRQVPQPQTITVEDPTLKKGSEVTVRNGHPGTAVDTIRGEVVNGDKRKGKVVSTKVIREAVAKKVAVGTKVAPVTPVTPATPAQPAQPKQSAPATPAQPAAPATPKPTPTPAPTRTQTPAPAPKPTQAPKPTNNTAPSGAGINTARADMWERIAKCESTNNWNINTGNGYYGGLQFDIPTWLSVGGDDFAPRADLATREQQITVANRLYAQRGLQPWECGHAAY